ncbi:MAG: hypothetical protein E7384_00565 [Ruminococcaceae bacterium]|nr:hypothetical protein [Oscillospiraceae bacterium]
MTKKVVLIGSLIVAALLVLSAGLYLGLVVFNNDMTDDSFECVETEKNGFVLKPYETYDESLDMKFVSFKICEKSSGEEMFICQDRYRSYDLHSVSFAGDSCDIIVSSGDVGDIVYKYEYESWQKQ